MDASAAARGDADTALLATRHRNHRGGRLMRSHLVPRTRAGWVGLIAFVALMALAQPPIVHGIANRIEPRILGLPFLYAWLLAVYTLLIGVLVWIWRRGL